ncbi:non-ribosomal peptide synthetase [Ruminococcus albus]|uniref:AMP-dependent synthetase and ligase n=1 Tax=Ruminococcus albus (strain ATCC 27210 / DSM 20455 / JCM 14654 / NCDO 2250 / 7) TaxID=697329 RepID=E6UAS9_RUMA7|nr:non-ribosomal peptide synthetase [Ruminococcus albus]ADU21408.1 AMP-dependent synthetase and ligase [Ruminococcus albus 7 = DSM 20455]
MQSEQQWLPSDAEHISGSTIQRANFALDKELSDALLAISNGKSAVLKILIWTAYNIFLNRLTGQKQVICRLYQKGDLCSYTVDIDETRTIREQLNYQLKLWKCEDTANDGMIGAAILMQNEIKDTESPYSIVYSSDTVSWIYNEASYSKERIRYYGEKYLKILREILVDQYIPISSIEWYDQEELEAFSRSENGFRKAIDSSGSFLVRLQKQAQASPERIAVFHRDGNVTYHELLCMAEHIRQELLRSGCGAKEKIAVFCAHRPFTIAAIVAIAAIGAFYVPVDDRTPPQRVQELLTENRIRVLLCESGDSPQADGICILQVSLDRTEIPIPPAEDEQTGYVIFTSGTTGKPKGILIDEPKLMNLCVWYAETFGIDQNSRVMLLNNFNFDASIKNLYTPLMQGAAVVCTKNGLFNTFEIIEDIRQFQVTHINCVPSLMAAILDTARHENFRHLESVQDTILGGDVFECGPLRLWAGAENCHSTFANVYGPAECTSVSTFCCIDRSEVLQSDKTPIGRPIYNKNVYVLNDTLRRVPMGTVGQIFISGLGVITGYETAVNEQARFMQAPWDSDELLYATGDLGAWDENGELLYFGRNDNQLKVNGQRIEAEELEIRAQSCREIESCIVRLWKDEGNNGHLVLYYTVSPGVKGTAKEEIRSYLRSIFPPSLVPQQYVCLEKLPLTANGKKDRDHLPMPVQEHTEPCISDASELEQKILEAWRLTLNRQDISLKEHFFEAGGSSLLLYKLKSEIDRILGTDIELVSLLNYTTVKEQAVWLSGKDEVKTATLQSEPEIMIQRSQIRSKRKQLLRGGKP